MSAKHVFAGFSIAAVIGLGVAGVPVIADHSWQTYHWATSTGIASAPIVDNTTGAWPARVKIARADWNRSASVESGYSTATTNAKRCPMKSGTIQVCNSSYGQTGWLGIASISLSGGHIVAGSTKLNDTYFNTPSYSSESWKQLVTCQEIGHDYGLGHQDENFNTDTTNSCMDYTSAPAGNEHPDQHDFDQLQSIYAHLDGAATVATANATRGEALGVETGDTPGEWGRAIGTDAAGRPNEYVRNFKGLIVITHVTWAPHVKVADIRQ